MEPHVSLDERLNQILTSFAKWHGDSEEAGRLMAANAVVIAAMQAEEQSHSPQTSVLAQQVIQAYQVFLDQVKAQQQEIKQELGRLNRKNNLVKTNLIYSEDKKMNYQKMQNNYLKNQVMSASPNKLIEMLLQAAIKNIKLAQLAIEKQELAKAHEHFIKTQNILLELRTSLDEKQGGEIAEGLAALYEYMYQQLIEANIKKEVVPAQAVAELLSELLESWQAITQSA